MNKVYRKRTMVLKILLLFWGINMCQLHAQETIPAAGGVASGSGGTVSYTVGQIAYSSNTTITGTVIEGVQQPYEILVITGIEEAEGIRLEISIYPNPTADRLILKIDNYRLENLAYQLYDNKGNLLFSSKIVENETFIHTGFLIPEIYYMKIIDNTKELKTFKIIKN